MSLLCGIFCFLKVLLTNDENKGGKNMSEIFTLIVLVVAIYGAYNLIKLCYKKAMNHFTKDTNGKLTYEQKKNLIDVIKLFSGAQVIGLLLYATPAINENIKIIVSVLVTLAGIVGAFLINEKGEKTSIVRTLIFISQEFFGITMILLMVNKGLGYSISNIFAIWSVYNFFIYKQVNKVENKVLFYVTTLVFLGTLLNNFTNIDMHILVIIFAVILLLINFLLNKEKLEVKIIDNIITTVFVALVFQAVSDMSDMQGVIYLTVLISLVAVINLKIMEGKLNLKAALVYIPYLVILLLSDFEIELLCLFSVFSALGIVWLLSENSGYKKALCTLGLFSTMGFAEKFIAIDEMTGIAIFVVTIVFSLSYLFSVKKSEFYEGGEYHE